MPQMQPIMWLLFFILFSIILVIYNIMNYFTSIPKNNYNKNITTNNTNFYKWSW